MIRSTLTDAERTALREECDRIRSRTWRRRVFSFLSVSIAMAATNYLSPRLSWLELLALIAAFTLVSLFTALECR